ncbi:MAG: leucyl/phenylalanyl-tRNA--protein transferase, partial [Gammaproteobacteria bacterium]
MDSPVWLDGEMEVIQFPSANDALDEPNGLLAMGGNLEPGNLVQAYKQGIFPWFSDDQPVLWWSPNPRAVLFPERLKISRSLMKTLKRGNYRITVDTVFKEVICACAGPRQTEKTTWITSDMINAYCTLFDLGYAHSVETWQNDELVGGLYGVAIGRVFFGESMFHTATDASKVAFVNLVQNLVKCGFRLIDCQIMSAHLRSLGAEEIERNHFLQALDKHCAQEPGSSPWDHLR